MDQLIRLRDLVVASRKEISSHARHLKTGFHARPVAVRAPQAEGVIGRVGRRPTSSRLGPIIGLKRVGVHVALQVAQRAEQVQFGHWPVALLQLEAGAVPPGGVVREEREAVWIFGVLLAGQADLLVAPERVKERQLRSPRPKARFEVRRVLWIERPVLVGQARVLIHAARPVAPGHGAVDRPPGCEPIGQGELSAAEPLGHVEPHPGLVLRQAPIGRRVVVQTQVERQRHSAAQILAVLAVECQVVHLERAVVIDRDAAAEHPACRIVRLLQGLEVETCDHLSVAASQITLHQAHLLREHRTRSEGSVEEVIGPSISLGIQVVRCLTPVLLVVAPVPVEAVFQVGRRKGGDRKQVRPQTFQGYLPFEREGDRFLMILAWVVGMRDQLLVVVVCPGIVAIVQIGAEEGRQQPETVVEGIQQFGPGEALPPAVGVLSAQKRVLPEPVRPGFVVACANCQLLAKRHIERRGKLQQVVAAPGERDASAGHGGGIHGLHADQTGHGVGSEDGRLRALEDLNLVQIELHTGRAHAAQVHAVEDETDQVIGRFLAHEVAVLPHPSDLEVARPRGAPRPVEIGHRLGQILKVATVRSPQPAPVQHGHAGRGLAQGLSLESPLDDELRRREVPGPQADNRGRGCQRQPYCFVPDVGNRDRIPGRDAQDKASQRIGRGPAPAPGHIGAFQSPAGLGIDHLAYHPLRLGVERGQGSQQGHHTGEQDVCTEQIFHDFCVSSQSTAWT